MALAAVWAVGRPGPPEDGTFTSTLNLVASEQVAPTRPGESAVAFYSFVAAETPEIASLVAADIGPDVYEGKPTAAGILDSIETTELPEIGTLTFTFGAQPSEAVATEVAERFGFHLEAYAQELWQADYEASLVALEDRERELRATINTLSTEIEVLREQLTEEEIANRVSPDVTKEAELRVALESLGGVITEAEALRTLPEDERTPLRVSGAPTIAADPPPPEPLGFRSRVILALIVGVVLGIGLTFALHRFDTRLFNRKDAESAFALPVLSEIPKIRWFRRRGYRLITSTDPRAQASEAFRLLRSSIGRLHRLQQSAVGKDAKGLVVLVTSVSRGTGKSSVAANLAVATVNAGQTALIVGADLRQPVVERFFGSEPDLGLTHLIDETEERPLDTIDLDRYLQKTRVPSVTLLSSGHPVQNPGERLAAAGPLIEKLRDRFDTIIIDSPPMLVGNDVNEIVPSVDWVLLVARAGATTIEEAQWAKETAERIQAPLCGVALIGGTRGKLQHRPYGNRLSLLSRLISWLPLTRRSEHRQPQPIPADGTASSTGTDQPSLPFGSDLRELGSPGADAPPPPTGVPAKDGVAAADATDGASDGTTPGDESGIGAAAAVTATFVPVTEPPSDGTPTSEPAPTAKASNGSGSDEDATIILNVPPDISDLFANEDDEKATTVVEPPKADRAHDDDDALAGDGGLEIVDRLPTAADELDIELDLLDEDELGAHATHGPWKQEGGNGSSDAAAS